MSAVGLEPAAVVPWILGLDMARPPAQPPLRFARVGNGKSNLTYLVSDATGPRWILRRPPVGPRLASAHDVAREHRVLRALGPTAVPAPAVVGFTDDPAISEAPLLLMTFVDGVVLDDPDVAQRLDPSTCARLTASLVRALARVHEVDLRATGLEDLASHASYAARQLKRWRRQWSASRTRELPAVERLADRLEAAMPEQRELALVHGDYHLLNVIAAPGGEEIRAILDWELCTLGDPLADLGGLLAYWPQGADAADWALPAQRLDGLPVARRGGRALRRAHRPRPRRAAVLARARPVEDRDHLRGRAPPGARRRAQRGADRHPTRPRGRRADRAGGGRPRRGGAIRRNHVVVPARNGGANVPRTSRTITIPRR